MSSETKPAETNQKQCIGCGKEFMPRGESMSKDIWNPDGPRVLVFSVICDKCRKSCKEKDGRP